MCKLQPGFVAAVITGIVALTGGPHGQEVDSGGGHPAQDCPAPREASAIETSTLVENPSWSTGGRRNALDEHAFNPVRAKVKVGARVRFLNKGELPHTVEARDGSWTTGTLERATWAHVTFDHPERSSHCTDHPWAWGKSR